MSLISANGKLFDTLSRLEVDSRDDIAVEDTHVAIGASTTPSLQCETRIYTTQK